MREIACEQAVAQTVARMRDAVDLAYICNPGISFRCMSEKLEIDEFDFREIYSRDAGTWGLSEISDILFSMGMRASFELVDPESEDA